MQQLVNCDIYSPHLSNQVICPALWSCKPAWRPAKYFGPSHLSIYFSLLFVSQLLKGLKHIPMQFSLSAIYLFIYLCIHHFFKASLSPSYAACVTLVELFILIWFVNLSRILGIERESEKVSFIKCHNVCSYLAPPVSKLCPLHLSSAVGGWWRDAVKRFLPKLTFRLLFCQRHFPKCVNNVFLLCVQELWVMSVYDIELHCLRWSKEMMVSHFPCCSSRDIFLHLCWTLMEEWHADFFHTCKETQLSINLRSTT